MFSPRGCRVFPVGVSHFPRWGAEDSSLGCRVFPTYPVRAGSVGLGGGRSVLFPGSFEGVSDFLVASSETEPWGEQIWRKEEGENAGG